MKFNNLIYCLIALLASSIATGCSADPDDFPANGETASGYSLRLFLDAGSQPVSRAPEGDYIEGHDYENYIDIDGRDFRVALYDKDDNWLASVNPTEINLEPVSAGTVGSKRYTLEFKVSEELVNRINATHTVKVVMLANWGHTYPTLDASLSLTDMFDAAAEISYTTLPVPELEAKDKMPMYGVTQFDRVTILPNTAFMLGNIHLLRALAKVEVRDDPKSVAKISRLWLTRHNTRAVAMPRGVTHQDHYVKNNYDGDYVLYPSFHDSWNTTKYETSEQVELKRGDDGFFVIYVPEFKNVGRKESDRSRLRVRYDGIDNDYYIDFKYGEDITDVLRNNLYRFMVKKRPEEIIVVVQVTPYAISPLEPDFGLDTGSRLVPIYDENNQILYYYDPEKNIYYDKDMNVVRPYELEVDPFTGYVYERDDNRNPFCFSDQTTQKFYLLDRVTQIHNPYQEIGANRWLKIVLASDSRQIYFYDRENSRWLNTKGEKVEYDESNSFTIIRDGGVGNKICFYDPIAQCYRMNDGKSIILNPLENVEEATGYLTFKTPEGVVMYYYDPKKGTWFDSYKFELRLPPVGY